MVGSICNAAVLVGVSLSEPHNSSGHLVRLTIRESLRSEHGKPHTGSAEWYVRPFARVYVLNTESPTLVVLNGTSDHSREFM